jgi:hypothetical protein
MIQIQVQSLLLFCKKNLYTRTTSKFKPEIGFELWISCTHHLVHQSADSSSLHSYYLLKLGINFLACLSTCCEFFYFLLQVVLADIIVLLLAVRQSIFAPDLQTFIHIVHDFSFSFSSLQAEAPGTWDLQWLAASQA